MHDLELEVSRNAQIESESEDDPDTDTPERIAAYSPTLGYAGPKALSQPNRDMVNLMLPSPPSSIEDPIPPREAVSFETPRSSRSTDILQTLRAPRAGSLHKMWHDTTRDFNMLTVRTLRPPNGTFGGLVGSYSWYADATPVDALLPPGVPLSIKEICIYNPHRVRWQGIMLRLTHNDYRGQDILGTQEFFRGPPQYYMSPAAMNQIQRDTVMRILPNFKTTGYEGKEDPNSYTDQLKPGAYLEKKFKGYTPPTFDDLLRGLTSLPQGSDAGPLTQCLSWYLRVCNAFTPKLELNVLHSQALIRALRQPSNHIGKPNLNRLALDQWRVRGTFPSNERMALMEITAESKGHFQQRRPPKASLDIRSDPIRLESQVNITIRHVLTFPFLAFHRVVAEASKAGIHKAETQKALRSSTTTPRKRARDAVSAWDDTPRDTTEQTEPGDAIESERTPKRRRIFKDGTGVSLILKPKRPTMSPISPDVLTRRLDSSQPTVAFAAQELDLSEACHN
ncbi:hypothetical protein G6514_009806 [Epicoccum nigrum]|nr:hypothetical protein G6514_009806 [Epicoccum nigrum]